MEGAVAAEGSAAPAEETEGPVKKVSVKLVIGIE